MAKIIHIRCRHCGEPLRNRAEPYCPDCNLYLAYRAMPLILGMLLTGHLAMVPARLCATDQPQERIGACAYDDDAVLIWE